MRPLLLAPRDVLAAALFVVGCQPAPTIEADATPAETLLDPAWLAVDLPAEDELACTGIARPAGPAASGLVAACDGDGDEPIAASATLLRPMADPAVKHAPDPDAPAWRDAEPVLVEGGDPRCDVRQLGVYVRVECRGTWSNLTEALGGDLREVRLAHHEPAWDETTGRLRHHGMQRLVFPLRPGDRRVFQIGSIHGGWREAWSGSTDVVISALWLDGAYAPEIVISS